MELGTRRENWADEGGWGRTIGLKIDALPPWTGGGSSTQGASGQRMTRLTVTATSGLAPPPRRGPAPRWCLQAGGGALARDVTAPRRADRVFADAQAPPPPPFPSDPERRSERERQSVGSWSCAHPARRPLAARSRAASPAEAEARRAPSSRPLGAQASPRAPCASSLGRDAAVEA